MYKTDYTGNLGRNGKDSAIYKAVGGAKDTFTGAWESMTIPTENIPVEATVCGGVPSTATGTNVYMNSTVFLGYMSDTGYEKAYIKK